jgi:hypothetical protein
MLFVRNQNGSHNPAKPWRWTISRPPRGSSPRDWPARLRGRPMNIGPTEPEFM